jgi:hypothetical protein
MVYAAFVIDAYACRIIGSRCARTMNTPLVLDALRTCGKLPIRA